jgi:hypothetical protein
MKAIVVLLMLQGAAHAGFFDHLEDVKGQASLEYQAGYVDDGTHGLGLAGAHLRGQAGGKILEYRMGLDLNAGATRPGGFAYDVELYPIGVGLRLGKWAIAGVVGGVGASGATGTIDDAAVFPVEAALDFAVGAHVRVLARGRVAWVAGAKGRVGGAPDLPFGDELDGMLAIRIGDRWEDYDFPSSNGWYLGAAIREAEGARMYGAVIGHSLDAGTE